MPREIGEGDDKHQLGQFHTTRKDHILAGFEHAVPNRIWVDPFAGDGDLLDWVTRNGALDASGFDIDHARCKGRIRPADSLWSPIDYSGLWVVMNPPYLTRGRNGSKALYDLFRVDDLYKVAIRRLAGCEGGIMIVPSNFLSSPRARSIREWFFTHFRMAACKVFDEQVFDDTEVPTCACLFERRTSPPGRDEVDVTFCPSGRQMPLAVSERHGWIFGETYYEWIGGGQPDGVGRLCESDCEGAAGEGLVFVDDVKRSERRRFPLHATDNIIAVKVTDSRTAGDRIRLVDIRDLARAAGVSPVLVATKKSRHWAHIVFRHPPSLEVQGRVIAAVNAKFNALRGQYNSVFLTSYQSPSSQGTRKRVCLEDVYKMVHKARQEAEANGAK